VLEHPVFINVHFASQDLGLWISDCPVQFRCNWRYEFRTFVGQADMYAGFLPRITDLCPSLRSPGSDIDQEEIGATDLALHMDKPAVVQRHPSTSFRQDLESGR